MKNLRYSLYQPLAVLAFLVALPTPARAVTHHIQMVGISFSPNTLTIKVGDDVVWTNASNFGHTTTSGTPGVPDGIWGSALLLNGEQFSRTFVNAGKFPFYCIPHGGIGMTGEITVEVDATGVGNPGLPVYSLGQNYPNPFNPATTIDYSIERPAHVLLEVYDARARRVRILEDGRQEAGPHAARFDGKDWRGDALASGIYFYQLSLDGVTVQMRKMVLIK